MPSLTIKSFSALVQEQAAHMQGRAKRLLDFSVGSFLRAITESNAGIGIWMQSEMLKVLAATRASTSAGADLDSWVEDFGLYRLGGQSARGIVTFSRFTPSVQAVVPVGATVQTLDNTATFVVVADTSNSNFNVGLNGYVMAEGISSIDVPVVAQEPGSTSNVAASTVGYILSQITYVDTVTNTAAISGGGAAESDAALRARFISYIQSLSRGTIPALLFAATAVAPGLQAKAQEGLNADGTPNDGFVCITVALVGSDPTPDAATMTLCATNVDSYRAGGIWTGVFPPDVKYCGVSMLLTIEDGYPVDDINAAVSDTLNGYLNGMKLGQSLSLTRIAQLAYGVSPGITNVSDITANGNALDFVITERQIIRSGGVALS